MPSPPAKMGGATLSKRPKKKGAKGKRRKGGRRGGDLSIREEDMADEAIPAFAGDALFAHDEGESVYSHKPSTIPDEDEVTFPMPVAKQFPLPEQENESDDSMAEHDLVFYQKEDMTNFSKHLGINKVKKRAARRAPKSRIMSEGEQSSGASSRRSLRDSNASSIKESSPFRSGSSAGELPSPSPIHAPLVDVPHELIKKSSKAVKQKQKQKISALNSMYTETSRSAAPRRSSSEEHFGFFKAPPHKTARPLRSKENKLLPVSPTRRRLHSLDIPAIPKQKRKRAKKKG